MRTEINDKRENFRMEIINKQKEEMFKKRRMQNLHKLNNNKQIEDVNYTNQAFLNSLQQLEQGYKVQENLHTINQGLSGNDVYRITMLLMDKGFHLYLMKNLINRQFLEESLQTISLILQSPKVQVGHHFVRQALLQHLVLFIRQLQFSLYCCNILGNLSIQCRDYGQILLSQKVHHILFEVLQGKVLSHENRTQHQQRLGESIMRTLCVLTEVAQASNIEYQEQMMQILGYCQRAYQYKISIEYMLQIFYFSSKKYLNETQTKIVWILNDLLTNLIQKQQCGNTLLIVSMFFIKESTELKFQELFRICIHIPYYISRVVRIMNKMLVLENFERYFPKDRNWWEKLCTISSKVQDKDMIINIMQSVEVMIVQPWTFRFLSEFLETSQSVIRQKRGLKYVQMLLRNERQEERIDYFIHAHQIHVMIQALYSRENRQISELSAFLLSKINSKKK